MHSPYPPFAAIEQAVSKTIIEARTREIRLKNVELVTTSEKWDDSLAVLFFYENESDVVAYEMDGTTEMIKQKFLNNLAASKSQFSFTELPKTNVVFDSHENVVKNYKGSYFLYLR